MVIKLKVKVGENSSTDKVIDSPTTLSIPSTVSKNAILRSRAEKCDMKLNDYIWKKLNAKDEDLSDNEYFSMRAENMADAKIGWIDRQRRTIQNVCNMLSAMYDAYRILNYTTCHQIIIDLYEIMDSLGDSPSTYEAVMIKWNPYRIALMHDGILLDEEGNLRPIEEAKELGTEKYGDYTYTLDIETGQFNYNTEQPMLDLKTSEDDEVCSIVPKCHSCGVNMRVKRNITRRLSSDLIEFPEWMNVDVKVGKSFKCPECGKTLNVIVMSESDIEWIKHYFEMLAHEDAIIQDMYINSNFEKKMKEAINDKIIESDNGITINLTRDDVKYNNEVLPLQLYISKFHERVTHLEHVNAELETRIGALRTDNNELITRIHALEDNNKTLIARIHELENESDELRIVIDELEKTNDDLQKNVDLLEKHRAELVDKINELCTSTGIIKCAFRMMLGKSDKIKESGH